MSTTPENAGLRGALPGAAASLRGRPLPSWPIADALDPERECLPASSPAPVAERELDSLPAEPTEAAAPDTGAPALDDGESAIDELAFVLATDHLSMLEKVTLLEQWRYDMLLRDVAAGEGLGAGDPSGGLLQQINKALLYLANRGYRH